MEILPTASLILLKGAKAFPTNPHVAMPTVPNSVETSRKSRNLRCSASNVRPLQTLSKPNRPNIKVCCTMIRDRTLSRGCHSRVMIRQYIADASHCVNEVLVESRVNFAAQAVDVDVDNVG